LRPVLTGLVIHESFNEAGARETVVVSTEEDGALVVSVDGAATQLPMVVLERVMERYGKPLEDGIALDGDGSARVDLGNGSVLHRIRHRGFYDVIARDFVVWTSPGREPLAELASGISAALVHFVNAARRVG
jgi:hypothetical protein